LLGAANNTLTIRHDRHRQNGENARNNPSRFHVLSPRTNSDGTSLAGNRVKVRVRNAGAVAPDNTCQSFADGELHQRLISTDSRRAVETHPENQSV
jgi:hypothetical protein